MSADPNDPSSKVDLERRRVPLERKISLKFKEFRGFITEYSSNLSMGGMFIRTSSPKPVGTIFDFELSLTDDFKLVQGIGEVIWVRESDDGAERPSGMGVRFLDLSSESRRLIQRIVEEQVAHGGTPFELEPPGFPPPPLRQAPTAPRPRPGAGGQSTLFHPTAAPVSPAPPPPGRAAGASRPSPPRAATAAAAAAAPLAAADTTPAPSAPGPVPPEAESQPFPDLGPPELPISELASPGSELLPGLEDFESEALEGFELVEDRGELPRNLAERPAEEAGLGGVHDDPTLLRGQPSPVGAGREDLAGGVAADAAAAGDAGTDAPGGRPRGRGLPSGFDEVARAFSEPPKPAEPLGEPVRIAPPLEMPPEPSRPAIPAAATSPRVEPPPRAASPVRAPARRPAPRRRSSLLPVVAAAVLLLLLTGLGVVYLRFPGLLPAWARAPQLDDSADEVAGPDAPLPASAVRSDEAAPGAAPSPASQPPAGAAAAPVPPQDAAASAVAASPAPTSVTAAGSASPGTPPAAPSGRGGAPRFQPEAADGAPRARFSSVEEIWGQRSSLGTTITIVTNGTVPAEAFSHFRLDGGNPREVIRLRDVDDRYRRTSIPVGTAEVEQVRLGYHANPNGNELHIVLDLASPSVQLVRLQPVDNRLELLFARQ